MEEEEEKVTIEGWTLDPREVRQIASRIGIPTNTPVPRVIVTTGKEGAHLGESDKDPSGFWISISEDVLAKHSEEEYTLGQRGREDVRHELAHYMEHLERGTRPGKAESPKIQAEREIEAELRGRTGLATSKYLYYLMVGLLQDYDDLSVEQSVKIVRETALRQGISRGVISRAENLFQSYRETL